MYVVYTSEPVRILPPDVQTVCCGICVRDAHGYPDKSG